MFLRNQRHSILPKFANEQLPLGEIIGILRRTLPIEDFSVLLSRNLQTLLSTKQVIGILQTAKSKTESEIREIQNEIKSAEQLSVFGAWDKEVLNEEGLPIREIEEKVGDEDEEQRGVPQDYEVPKKIYTMEEIDRMMDEAMAEEEAELKAHKAGVKEKATVDNGKKDPVKVVAGEGLEVGQVSGEELLAKIVDDSKNRYNPMDGTWIEDEEDGDYETEEDDEDYEDDDDEEEEEEDQYGRTRGFLVPPHLLKGKAPERGVRFASFEKPPNPPISSLDKPLKSALKKSEPSLSSKEESPTPATSSEPVPDTSQTVVATDVVERLPNPKVRPCFFSRLMKGYREAG